MTMIRPEDMEAMSATVADQVVQNLMGSQEIQQLLMDEIDRVMFNQFGLNGIDECLEDDISFTALQRISLISH